MLKRGSIRKILLISGALFISVLLIIAISVFFIIRSYIKKINIVSAVEETYIDEEELEPEPEDLFADITDSPKEEIDLIEERIRKNMEDNQTPIVNDDDVTNILLIGSDTRKKGGFGRSDAMIIVSINKRNKTITATSILRDIYLKIPGKKNNRINAAYALGGAGLLMDTIEKNFKIKVDRFVSVDFYAFIEIVDAVGGIKLDVTDKEVPIINNYVEELNRLNGQDEALDKLTGPGSYLLNGKQTLGYVRNRYIGTDFARTARQREVLEKIFNGVKGLSITRLNGLMNEILPEVTTNLTEGEIFSLILSLPTYALYDLQQLTVPVSNSYKNLRINNMAVLGIDFEKNIKEIRSKIYGAE
ncbi:LytR family transcriptional attenuator [Herbinix hemicellulosilytica]|uniref:Cell envelope-related transcriptional attenuator domain-containing protein n=1 Tax=Herbinix hemicellulosilytica TaxID=1564487 RepID=A0A0H5SGP8_HERHM|nr:LCP family protein [Herbinix hemicellulosilytica]RBP60939.1 LytR family transcriptional attenuator [Herbinix hemicellulosilytica]CRZ34634.1 hypothetical protein HHT355_1433 [Herbinix hemicellulosilytica]